MSFTIRPLICAVLATGLATSPVHAQAARPVQLLQPGDGQKSCEALATEINALAAAEAAPAKKKRGFGLGGLGKMLTMANPMLALANSRMGGAIMSQVASAAHQGAMQSTTDAQTDAAMRAMGGGASVEVQRKARLMGLYQAKGC